MKRALALLVVAGCAVVAGCSSTDAASFSGEPQGGGDGRGTSGTNPGDPGTGSSGALPPSDPGSSSSSGSTPGGDPQVGKLTAGVWDDNLNYDFFGKYLTASTGISGLSIFGQADRDAAHLRAAAQASAKTELDITLLLDTTSSMGDELSFLQQEFQTIADTVKAKFPQTTPRFGLVLYRDISDDYTTRPFPFTTDVAQFRANLAAQVAYGGGDIPEAVPEGLDAGVSLGWRTTDDVARVMFWVADAPQHHGEEQKVKAAVDTAVQKGIKIYPVGASGVDASAELTMRGTAQITGGRYVFLTDDSGVGNAHAEPHIPCYVVTKLEGAIVRMVESEMNGTRVEPAAADVIRTVGDPKDGKCTMKDQSTVVLY
jgi:von Willebrand factor type A domain